MSEETPLAGFIVGMSRAGTTWMSQCLNEHSSVAVFGETMFWGRNYVEPKNEKYGEAEYSRINDTLPGSNVPPTAEGSGGLRPLLQQEVTRLQANNESVTPRQLFERFCRAVARAEEKPKVIEKTPHHINWLDRIVEAYPNAKFIVMYRNAYDFMLSYKHQGDRKPPGVKEIFKKLYHPLGCSLVYRGYARSVLEAADKYPERTLLIDFSEIVKAPNALLKEVQQFLGLDQIEQLSLPAANSSFPASERPELEADDIFWMNLVAAKEMRALGSEIKKVPEKSLPVLRSFLRLPLWSWAAISHMLKHSTSPVSYLKKWLS